MSRQMKDSGIPWIGAIPENWKSKRFKYSGSFQKGKLPSNTNDENIGLPIIGASEMLGKTPRQYSTDNSVPICNKNDILILWDGANAGLIASNLEGIISSTAASYTCHDKSFYWNYIYYLLKSSEPYFKDKVFGTTIPHMNLSYIDDIPMLLPPFEDQKQIADFLDQKCGEVDEMVSLQEKIIEELKAYKQAIITEAVCKGLNPDAEMKDSGIKWLGDIPKHWKMEPLKYILKRRQQKNNPILTTERLSLSIDKGITLYAEKTTNLDRFKEDFTQYQVAYPNDIVLNCMNMIVGAVGLSKYMGCVSPVYYVIYPSNEGVDALYYSYLLNIPTIRGLYYSMGKGIYAIERGEGRVNTCRLKVSYDDFGRLDIPVPPIDEQKEITKFIVNKSAEIENLIALKQQKIEELKEYKKSIIYEYITGKKEVV